jgi:hypothetical protein
MASKSDFENIKSMLYASTDCESGSDDQKAAPLFKMPMYRIGPNPNALPVLDTIPTFIPKSNS